LHERRKATALPNSDAGHARRALLVLGLMALHYDFDPVRPKFAPDGVVLRVCGRHEVGARRVGAVTSLDATNPNQAGAPRHHLVLAPQTAFVREGVYELALDYARSAAMPALQPAAIQSLGMPRRPAHPARAC